MKLRGKFRGMYKFKVIAIVDGDTFDVEPNWSFGGKSGSRVRPAGYDAPELSGLHGAVARSWLSDLLLHKTVQLGTAYRVDRGRLVCEVFLNGQNLAEHYENYFDRQDSESDNQEK